ncbi:AMP-binding protein [Desulfovibrio sulfodismutans]|uniref:AMP-binding protein n=1 Tax=Desulfolutivibrio sulfodismutans TaxID=63561 RepID=A0A7K3NJE4_9BACT|nr:AMP-binding protein [Desulfolutivibrio sulfodismutans]NDY55923.1 AMP-binding protein [Desulfolutivibrio sulfodismutans]QLA11186.1 AMP-binding protein [Desulfolutivibrio sulfodismutans DSM 3696]
MSDDTPLFDLTMGQLLAKTAAANPDTEAVVYVDRDFRLTYSQFDKLTDDLAKGLMALGVQKGEKVAVWATNVPYWVALQFATAKMGAILLTVNTNYKRNELKYLLTNSECENIFIIDGFRDSDYIQILYDLAPELRSMERGRIKSTTFPHLKRVFFLGPEKHRGMYNIPEVLGMARMVTDEEYAERQATLHPDDVVNMQYTSGTTGFPKGVMLTHKSVVNNGYWIGQRQRFSPKDRLCLTVPLFHCFGCVLGVMACVNHGVTMVIVEAFNPVSVMSSIDQERCTAVYGVPTMFIAMLEHKLFKKFDFSCLRTGIMAGSPCPIQVMRQVMDLMYMKEITICYGLTENSPVMTQTTPDDPLHYRVESVGKALPHIEVCVRDPETGLEVPHGVQGEVCCRGYSLMKGYYNNPEATAKAITPDGWLRSGDLGTMDENGYLAITGRLKDMIIRGGENIYPREIEEFLYTLEGVSDVQVAGVPSRKYGEEVGAFIILKKGVTMAPEDVRDYCRGQIAWHKIPKYVAFVDSYPITASGKIQKYKLRELAGEMFPEAMN